MGNAEVTLSNKLQVIATIQPGYTLSVKTMSIIYYSAWGRSSRWWNAESRIQTMNWIDDVVTQAIDKLKTQFDTKIWQDLKAAQAGIRHLEVTYSGDNEIKQRVLKTVERIDTLEKEYPAEFQHTLKVEKKTSHEPNPSSEGETGSRRPNDCALTISPISEVSVGNSTTGTTEILPPARREQLPDMDSDSKDHSTVQRTPSPVANPQPLPLKPSYKDALLAEKKKPGLTLPGLYGNPDPAQYLRQLTGQTTRPQPIPKITASTGTTRSHTYPHDYIRGFPRVVHPMSPPVIP